jgi:hypothetical protein
MPDASSGTRGAVAVENGLSEEQMASEPNFAEKLKSLQTAWDEVLRDIRKKFLLCLHEGAHAVRFRSHGAEVRFHGPHVEFEDGQAQFFLGAVSSTSELQIRGWERAAIKMAGFLAVERLTGETEDEQCHSHDVKTMEKRLRESPRQPHMPERFEDRLDRAKFFAEFAISEDMARPEFLIELERAVRDYEREVFGTEECWDWAWKEYRLDVPGEHFAVGLPHLGYAGLLIHDCKRAKLFITNPRNDGEYLPTDTVHDEPLFLASRRKDERAENVVRRWNEQAAAAVRLRVDGTLKALPRRFLADSKRYE